MARKNVKKKQCSIRLLRWFDFSQSENKKNNRNTFEGASVEPTRWYNNTNKTGFLFGTLSMCHGDQLRWLKKSLKDDKVSSWPLTNHVRFYRFFHLKRIHMYTFSWRSGYCYLNKRECNLNQSKYDSLLNWVAKNNSWNNDDRHKIHQIFLINCFVFIITLVWKTVQSSTMT